MLELRERGPESLQHFGSFRCNSIHPRVFRTLGLRRAKPSATCHPREQRIQRPRAQAIAVSMEFLQHPVSVHALLFGVVEDVNLPEREQELTDDGVLHDKYPN